MTDKPKSLHHRKSTAVSTDHVNIFSQWTFWWLNGLLTLGYRRPLQTEDVPVLAKAETSHELADKFEGILNDIYHLHQPGSKKSTEPTTVAGSTADVESGLSPTAASPAPLSAPPSFAWAIWRLVGWKYLSALAYAFIAEILAFAGPVLVQYITRFLNSPGDPEWHGWLFVALLFVLPTIASICRNAYFINSWRVAVRLRSAILTSVFRKSLKLSPAARRLVSDGEILTLMSADTQKLADIWPVLYVLLTAPLSIFACFVQIWLQVGPSTLAGAAVIAILMPCNVWLGKKSGGYRREEAAQTDLRMRYIKEAMSNMKVIKQYGWSSSFEKRITDVRAAELKIRKKSAYLEALSNSALILTPVLISLVTFLTFAGSGHELTATNVFTSMALFNVMRFQLSQFPLVLTALFEARVSLQRILRLLLREELLPEARDYSPKPLPPVGETIAKIDGCTFSWDMSEDAAHTGSKQMLPGAATSSTPALTNRAKKDAKGGATPAPPAPVGTDSNFRLSDISLDIKRGSFVAVVGSVGSGKSSLLQALLGEVKRLSGPKVFLRGQIALVPQTAWILNLTLKENILFGLELDESVYQRVIDLCCLRADLAQLPAGDQTQIGDRGVNLSGGQKQRTAIARAVYSILQGASDVLIIDDPLSAVDAHVSKALFDNILSHEGILGKMGITIILAMNQLHFLPHTDHIIVMEGGRIAQQGDYSTLMKDQAGQLAILMQSYGFQQDHDKDSEEEEEKSNEEGGSSSLASPPSQNQIVPATVASDKPAAVVATNSEAASTGPAVVAPVAAITTAAPTTGPEKPKAGASMAAETRMEGSVNIDVYIGYIRACGGWLVLGTLIFLFCIHQTGRVYADFWLADWAGQDWSDPTHSLAFWMGIFALFGGAVTLASLARSMIFARQGLAGAFNLHQSMLGSIFRSPASFFDTTPIGRIVNRFSGDIDKLDHLFIRILEGWGGCIFFVLGTIIAICVVFPYFALVLIGIIFIYWKVQQYYVATSRELQRLDSISKSPILSYFGESLTGASSIRAYGSSSRCHIQNESHIDANHRNVLAYQAALCWLGIRIELISTLLMTVSAIFAVSSRGHLNAALVGLTIVYSITITSFLNFAVRLGSVVEGLMSSVERIQEFSVLPSEAPAYLPDSDPPASWPQNGSIKFEKCVLRYRPELDTVLKGITAEIKGGEKIGIIGRTGSGKSSLMVALFRLVELSSGSISIDGIDISKIGLETLRGRVTLIPQDPVIFGGTVRYNLDPFHTATDEAIWHVLRLVNLENKIRSMDGGLEFILSEGESLSVGERQLLCVSRALLRQTSILILDEATASVDIESDVLIQQVIATQFQRSTVLAIAHRLSTIIDFDRILVMDGGQVAEFGVPHELLQDPNSALLGLVDATGPASAAHLKGIAKQSYENVQAGRPAHVETQRELPTSDEVDTAVDTSCVRFHAAADEQY